MRTWINFKELRARLKFADVLRLYDVEVKPKGDQHQGFCPLPNHNGKRTSESFSANLDKGIFQCFGCGAKGNVLEFAAMMDGIDEKDGTALRKVAMKLQKEFFLDGAIATRKLEPSQAELPAVSKQLPIAVNAPLDFELRSLEHGHEYLLGRGFDLRTIVYFGVGYCSRGILKGRVAIPLHDMAGRLIGYAGRVVDETTISPDNPKYCLPAKRVREGMLYEFKKSLFLYNSFRMKPPLEDLVVVEGFPSVWWLTQNRYPNTVATMGADCSEEQAKLVVSLVKPSGRVWVISDGDKSGERFGQSVILHVSAHRLVRWFRLQDGEQPTDLARSTIDAMLAM